MDVTPSLVSHLTHKPPKQSNTTTQVGELSDNHTQYSHNFADLYNHPQSHAQSQATEPNALDTALPAPPTVRLMTTVTATETCTAAQHWGSFPDVHQLPHHTVL